MFIDLKFLQITFGMNLSMEKSNIFGLLLHFVFLMLAYVTTLSFLPFLNAFYSLMYVGNVYVVRVCVCVCVCSISMYVACVCVVYVYMCYMCVEYVCM